MSIGLNWAEESDKQRQRFGGYVLLQMGLGQTRIAAKLEVSPRTVFAWGERFADGPNIWDSPRSGRKRKFPQDIEDRLIAFYCQTSPLSECGHGRWSMRTAEVELAKDDRLVGSSLSRSTIQRMLARHGLKPHRTRYFMQITDPDFFPKMEHLIKLYQSPPEHIFCFDECPGLQVLQRLAPDCRPADESAALEWINEFEYIRHGTLDVFAFLEVQSGNVHARVRADHTKATFLSVFRQHIDTLPEHARPHYVMDNLDSHCSYEFCKLVAELSDIPCPPEKQLSNQPIRRQWLSRTDKRITIHFTPFHGSWLNMVEIWFRILQHSCLKDSYQGPDELRDAILEFALKWSDDWAHPFTWKYDGSGLHQKAVTRFTRMLKHSADEITLQLLTKECKLMANLIQDYFNKVDAITWESLFQALVSAEDILRKRIASSTQPIVKVNALQALELLLHSRRNCDSCYAVAS